MNLARQLYRYLKTGSFETADYLSYQKFLSEHDYQYKKSYFNLTIDFELGWSRMRGGREVTSTEKSSERARRSKVILPVLLELCDTYKVPVTFAIVGQIGVDDVSGRGLIEAIRNTTTHHEIASHGFSHVDLSDSGVTREMAEFEIRESVDILKRYENNLSTFIFPNNHPAHLDLLRKYDFTTYRTRNHQKIKSDRDGLRQFPIGLWLSPEASSPESLQKLIDTAIAHKQLVNFWCHLFEFSSEAQCRSFFEPIFAHIESCRKTGTIEASTMRDIITAVNE